MFCFLGDSHGNFNHIKWMIKTNQMSDMSVFHVGDLGIGFTTHKNDMLILSQLNEFLSEKNIILYVIRGSHDNPYFFNGHLMDHFTNIKLLPDYTIIEKDGYKILCIGGAISIDRKKRVLNKDWWENENFVLDRDKLKNINNNENIILLTHTAPTFTFPVVEGGFPPSVTNNFNDDPTLESNLIKERMDMDRLYEMLTNQGNNIILWCYGHFHDHIETIIDKTKFRLIDINEFYDPRLDIN